MRRANTLCYFPDALGCVSIPNVSDVIRSTLPKPPALALQLARATVAGAGALAVHADEDPAVLRRNVTSPGGTTAAGLDQLMDPESGLPPLMRRTIAAAAARGRELGR